LVKVLKADKRAVFTAAARAQQAADYVEGLAKPAPSAPAEVAEAA
jgi:antirestriction protein ArdC